MKYYDVHTHTNYPPLDQKADEIARNCLSKGIIYNDIGTNLVTSQLAIDHARKHQNVFACIGIHPNDVDSVSLNECINTLEKMLNDKSNKVIAIGETGLDYHYEGYNKQRQAQFFIAHIELAKKYHLPLMIHIRDAHDDAYEILKQHASNMQVIIHCFTGNQTLAKQYTDLGFYISIPGVITFKNANELKNAIKTIPLKQLLTETDAPWLTPVPYRGQTNTPEYVPYVVKEIANILHMDETILTNQVFDNAIKLFKPIIK